MRALILKAIICLFLPATTVFAEGLGIGGGPPVGTIPRPDFGPITSDSTSTNSFKDVMLANPLLVVSDGLLCRESIVAWKAKSLDNDSLIRWPIESGTDCLGPLKEFSRKLSFAKAPLALSFATFVDGLEKHLNGRTLSWRNCTGGCVSKSAPSPDCIDATPLIQRVVQIPGSNEIFVLNQHLWEEVSQKQPLVCAAAVVDLWLSTHVKDEERRLKMVNDFFSSKFHANDAERARCFDPTDATAPIQSFGGEIDNILKRFPRR